MANSKGNMRVGIPEVIMAPRTDPIYNCHTYLTKVPVAAILPFIKEFADLESPIDREILVKQI